MQRRPGTEKAPVDARCGCRSRRYGASRDLPDEKRRAFAVAQAMDAPDVVARCADVAEQEIIELAQDTDAVAGNEATQHRAWIAGRAIGQGMINL
jgi:hypothetical protein